MSSAAERDRGARGAPINLQHKVMFLRDPRSYRERVRRVRCLETHFAWVFLTSRYVYKLKKPLRQREMDYRSLRARRIGCREELRLNRRLAAGVYLAVVRLSADRRGALHFDGAGRTEEYLVKMRRLPGALMLDRLVVRGGPGARRLDALVSRLAGFYATAERCPVAPAAYLARLRRLMADNARVLRGLGARLPQALVERTLEAQRRYLGGAPAALAARGASVLEGHGDLRAEHVWLGRPVCVIDCLEFDRELRLRDPADDCALLALEIERLGRAALGLQLLHRLMAALADAVPEQVLHFYLSLNAMTRAKLAAWHLGDPQFPDERPWIALAESYLRTSLQHARRCLRPPSGLREASAPAARSTADRATAA